MDNRQTLASPRDQTRLTLLTLIRQSGSATRSELVEATGFSRSTVGHAVNRLIADHVVEETDPTTKGPGSGRGRPGTTLRPVLSKNQVAGIDFGHRHVSVAIADAFGDEIAHERFESGLDAVEKLDRAVTVLEELRRRHSIERLDAVVAGIPKPLDRETGRVKTSKSGDGWAGLVPALEIERRVGAPTRVENDASLGAFGEFRKGAARSLKDILYIKVAHGVGAGLILNGVPYHGADGVAGDIGHSRIPGRNELGRCGHRGCLEAVASIDAIQSQIAETHPGSDPATALDNLDEISERIINDAGRALGGLVAYFCNLLNPAAVVIGGSLGSAHPSFIDGVSWSIREYARPTIAETTQVSAAELGARAELVGALQMAADLAMRGVNE